MISTSYTHGCKYNIILSFQSTGYMTPKNTVIIILQSKRIKIVILRYYTFYFYSDEPNINNIAHIIKKFDAMHFIYQIHRLTTTKVDSTYLG